MSRGTFLDFLKFWILTPFLVKKLHFKDHFDDKITYTNRMRVIFICSSPNFNTTCISRYNDFLFWKILKFLISTTPHRFFYITQSEITIFYYIFNFIKMFLKSSFLTFQNGRFLYVRLQTHYFSFSFMIFHFIIRILHVQIIFLHRRRRPPWTIDFVI